MFPNYHDYSQLTVDRTIFVLSLEMNLIIVGFSISINFCKKLFLK